MYELICRCMWVLCVCVCVCTCMHVYVCTCVCVCVCSITQQSTHSKHAAATRYPCNPARWSSSSVTKIWTETPSGGWWTLTVTKDTHRQIIYAKCDGWLCAWL